MPDKEVTAMPEQIMEDQIAEVVTQAEQDYGARIPEHAILRFARFLLPKIQADLEKKEE